MGDEQWERVEKTEKGGSSVTYSCVINDIKVSVCHRQIDGRGEHNLTLTRDDMVIENKDASKARDTFEIIKELGNTVRLMALSKVLEEVEI